jgi:hypothetical protein
VLLISTPGGPVPTVVFVPADRRRVVHLGTARAIVPAADDAHVWLANPSTGTGIIRKVDLSGRVVRRADLGDRRIAVRETAYGMVTVSIAYFSSSLELWDIDTQRVAHVYWVATDFVIAAADAEHTAFTLPSCARPACPVKIAGIRSGEVADIAMPAGWATSAASFSPDGSRLGVLGRRVSRDKPDEPLLVVADLRTGAVKQADGVEAATPRSSLLAWSPDSRWFFAAAARSPANLLGYRVGDRRVRYVADPRLAHRLEPADIGAVAAY